MDKSLIKKHNFEEAKNKIRVFSNNLPTYPHFDKVEESGGLFNWGNHNVTGKEMNTFVSKVQDRFISVNSSLRSVVSEFREIYKALDFLDKEYIDGILVSVEAAEKASQQALEAQSDIFMTIEVLQQTVKKLEEFKTSVCSDISILSEQIIFISEKINEIKSIQESLANANTEQPITKEDSNLIKDIENGINREEQTNVESRNRNAYIIAIISIIITIGHVILQLAGVL